MDRILEGSGKMAGIGTAMLQGQERAVSTDDAESHRKHWA
jgi:hypothetical protein